MRTLYRLSFAAVTAGCVCTVVFAQQPPAPGQPAPAPPVSGGQAAPSSPGGRSTNLGSDPNGNPLRLALKTGHVSNYDEAKVGTYTLPDPLKMSDGKPVGDAKTWAKRRAEIMQLYETKIYGRTPANTPKVSWTVAETDPKAREGASVRKKVVGTVGTNPDAQKITVMVTTPANATKAVPVILLVNFGGGPPPPPGTRKGPGLQSSQRSAGSRRDPGARVGLCDRRVRRHPARSRQHGGRSGDGACATAAIETGVARRVGHHRRRGRGA